jgi:hypothetical protein
VEVAGRQAPQVEDRQQPCRPGATSTSGRTASTCRPGWTRRSSAFSC